MYKNIVFIHLESISNTILWQYRVELETVWKLMHSSYRYTRFYSAATSTKMAVLSLQYGNSFLMDSMPHYFNSLKEIDEKEALRKASWFFRYFIDAGFTCSISQMEYMFRQEGFLDESEFLHHTLNSESFAQVMKQRIAKADEAGKPFMMFLNNNVSHMAMDDGCKIRAETFSERFYQGYLSLDHWFKKILATLVECGKWENTIIVCYGDHGDEMWSHSLTRGFCHGMAPYASLTWTPFFVFEHGGEVRDDDRLVSMVDVLETIIRKVSPDYVPGEDVPPFRMLPFSGIDIGSEKNRYVFSQNLYALQLENDDLEKALIKGYAVTDGIYRLIAVSGGKRGKEGGLEFYYDRLDPMNSRNLLDFFALDGNGDIVSFKPPSEAVTPEFSLVFTAETVAHMKQAYQTLKHELHEYVRTKEKLAIPYNDKYFNGVRHFMPESAFKFARKRIRKDYNE